jgi:hypothetical protein
VRVLAAIAAALSLPQHGSLVPGSSLGGIRLGMTAAQVERAWGRGYGVCRGCPRTTWYFTYRKFAPQGAGVELDHGRVVAVFTLWSPPGWHTTKSLTIGDPTAQITLAYGPLRRIACTNYSALVLPGRKALTAFYVVGETLWGFGLVRLAASACLSR